MSLNEIRAGIDQIDQDIVALIAQREQLVRAAAAFKTDADAVRAPDRVERVIAGVRSRAESAGADPDLVERVYRVMIESFIGLELKAHSGAERPVQ